jgi:uncharacterized protein (DUF488 family)
VRVYTIGFTRKSADQFFEAISASGAERVVDIRLNNTSQLAAFAKRDDLAYFLQRICGAGYEHVLELAPTEDLLSRYRKRRLDWQRYELEFLDLLRNRRIEQTVPRELIDASCLLCSEPSPERCHRRLVAEYLRDAWGDVEIVHLG